MDELATIGLAFVMNRWVYVLAKKYNKPTTSYTAISVLIFLVVGGLIAQIAAAIIIKHPAAWFVNFGKLFIGLWGLSGSVAVAVFYFILRQKWKSQRKKTSDTNILDDRL